MEKKVNEIIVIDDDRTTRTLVSGVLVQAGYHVTEAVDGQDGLDRVTRGNFDLIILDVKMPKLDGWSFVKKIHGVEEKRDIPILVLTAYDSMKDLFTPEGVVDYLVKPVQAGQLLSKVQKLLKQ